jgi:hypothetical protein
MMAATKSDIKRWFEEGVSDGATHMIVVCDTFDHEDYPVFVRQGEDVREKEATYQGRDMQRVMEVYNLGMDMGDQLSQHRAFNY